MGYSLSNYPEEETNDVEVVKEDSRGKRKREDEEAVIQKSVFIPLKLY